MKVEYISMIKEYNESWLETGKSNSTVRIRITENAICKLYTIMASIIDQ